MSSLTLSGGGFRATFFHLGVINYLRETRQLEGVKRIYSVSGGSILAAHLVLNWSSYKSSELKQFKIAAGKLVDFAQRDLRGRVVRRWLLCWLCAALLCLTPVNVLPYLQPFGLGLAGSLLVGIVWLVITGTAVHFFRNRWSRIKWLEYEYGWLFRGKQLKDLIDEGTPLLHLLNTDLTSADFGSFSGDGVRLVLTNLETDEPIIKKFDCPDLSVALGVAASSAYPALFPPVQVTRRLIEATHDEMPHTRYLADGGVYENLGTRARLRLAPTDDRGPLVVCDAQRETGTLFEESFGLLTSRSVRTTDILMKRVNKFENDALSSTFSFQPVRLHDLVSYLDSHPENERPLNEKVQRRILKVRTDLDVFTPAEVQLLVYQGYAAALRAFNPTAALPGFQFTPGQMPFPLPKPQGKWLPYTIENRRVDPDALHALRKSDRTRYGLFAWSAPLFYVNALLLLLLVSLLYPSLLGWAWLGGVLPSRVRSPLPVMASYVPLKDEHEAYLSALALSCGDAARRNGETARDVRSVHYRAGPFNATASRPIPSFTFELPISEGYEVKQTYGFLLKNEQGNRYMELQRDQGPNGIRIRIPACQGDESLLLILCVQRKTGLGDWPDDATKLFQPPEVKP